MSTTYLGRGRLVPSTRLTCQCERCAQSAEGQCRYPGLATSERLLCSECAEVCNDRPGRRDGH